MRMQPPRGARVAIYARYSTTNQNFKSIEDQVRLCREYAERQGWIVVAVYHDAERSGSTVVGREGFFRMMAAADAGEFDVLLCEEIDRLSRNAADMHGLVQTCDELDIVVCTQHGVVSDLEVAFKAIQNQQYNKLSAEKTRRGQEGTVKSGRISGSVSYGYKKKIALDLKGEPINGLREVDSSQSWVVERIFREYVGGKSTFGICKDLNAEGISGPRGKHWRPGALTGSRGANLGVLRNRLYIGEFVWGRTRRRRKKGKITTKPTASTERLVANVPELRIIDDELFNAAQEILAGRGEGRFHEWRQTDYLLGGKCVCGECGSKYVVMNKRLGCTGRHQMGICTNSRRVPREAVEDGVLDKLKERLLHADLLAACLGEYRMEARRATEEQRSRTDVARVRIGELDRQIANMVNQLREGLAPGLAGQIIMQEIERSELERQRLQREVEREPRPVLADMSGAEVVSKLSAVIDDLRRSLSSGDHNAARARELIRNMIDKVVIAPVAGTKADGRGAGPVMITVVGRLGELLELSGIHVNQNTQHASRPGIVLDNATSTFTFFFELEYRDPRLSQVLSDLGVVSRLLDDADAPVTRRSILDALQKAALIPIEDGVHPDLDLRLRRATVYLQDRGLARAIMAGPDATGWVWNEINLTDGEWRERAMRQKPPGYEIGGVIRMGAPHASVVIIK